ncbi:MAG: thioredoxin [Abditibacteriota bacterium]|nr:thioredoxin [Abditibacteriota bacterium]
MSNIKAIGSADFEQEVLKADLPVLVDFWATWCGPCKMLAPIIDQLAGEYEGKVRFVKVDIDDNGDLAQQYGIMSIPTVILFKGGSVEARTVGLQPKPALKKLLDAAL